MKQPGWELADVIDRCRARLEKQYLLTSRQKKILTLLSQCRTSQMGGHIWHCKSCRHEHIDYNSCRDRHCPKCNGIKRLQWVGARKAEALPGGYAHVVCTLPHDLNPMIRLYREKLYTLLFQAAWETIQKLASDARLLGAKTGMIAVLHSWEQNLGLHVHLHCLVPMGGITPQGKWKTSRSKGKYLFPKKVLSKVFRGKFTDGLYDLDRQGVISMKEKIDLNQKYLHPLYRRKWVVYAKKPLTGGEKTLEYIGRYVHRIAIANSRIKDVSASEVTFSWIDYRHSRSGTITLDGLKFLRRFLDHILPEGFVKVRHYGILSNKLKNRALQSAYDSLDRQRPEKPEKMQWHELVMAFYGFNPLKCPVCGKAELIITAILPPKRAGPVNDDFSDLQTNF